MVYGCTDLDGGFGDAGSLKVDAYCANGQLACLPSAALGETCNPADRSLCRLDLSCVSGVCQ